MKCKHRWNTYSLVFPGDQLSQCSKCLNFKLKCKYPDKVVYFYYTVDKYYQAFIENSHYYKYTGIL